MSISTLSELRTAIGDWLHRSDLATRIPDFISMAEAYLNRKLSLHQKEVDVPLIMTVGSRYVALPSAYNSPVSLWLETYLPRQKLTMRTASELPVQENVSAPPQYWAIDGINIAFDTLADQSHSLTLRYERTLALSDSSPTNTILASNPDAYLYSALVAAAPYLRDDARLLTWKALRDEAVQEILNNESKNKSRAPLATDLGGLRGPSFNINRGY